MALEEWQARLELAALYRIFHARGWDEARFGSVFCGVLGCVRFRGCVFGGGGGSTGKPIDHYITHAHTIHPDGAPYV